MLMRFEVEGDVLDGRCNTLAPDAGLVLRKDYQLGKGDNILIPGLSLGEVVAKFLELLVVRQVSLSEKERWHRPSRDLRKDMTDNHSLRPC